MANTEIVDYISKSLRRGISWEETRNSLLSSGYSDVDINDAVSYINKTPKKLPNYSYTPRGFDFLTGLKWLFFGILMLGLMIALFFVFARVFSFVGSNVIDVSENAISSGSSFDLKRNSFVKFDYEGQSFNFEVKEVLGVYSFSDEAVRFVLSAGETKDVDLNSDGVYDIAVSLTSSDVPVMSISKVVICYESWSCTEWSPCISESKKRICTDSNFCGTFESRPLENEVCTESVGFNVSVEGFNETIVLNETNSSYQNESNFTL